MNALQRLLQRFLLAMATLKKKLTHNWPGMLLDEQFALPELN